LPTQANVYGQNSVSNYLHDLIKTTNATARPFHVVWYRPATSQIDNRPLDYFLRGDFNELVLMRSSWSDPNALWVGVKSGVNSSNHSHLDLGNFELDAGGVRWARDFGVDDYNLPGYWNMGVNGQRWTYYRLNSLSHNICVLGNKNQYEIAMARFTQTDLNTLTPSATIDLTQAYEAFSSKSSRKVSMIEGRKAVQIEDNFTLTKPTEIAWGMTTAQIIDIKKGGKAILLNSTGSRSLEAQILAPAGAEFSEESAERKAPEKLNTGNRRLMIRLPNQTGTVKIVVKFTPK
jgi:Heparinase II/III-like protein